MKKSKIIAALLAVSAAVSAQAAVSITAGQIAPLRNSAGSIINVGTLGLLVVDQSNNGLLNAASTVLSAGSFIGGGSDDLIVNTFLSTDLSGTGDVGFDFSGAVINISGNTTAGDALYFVWFPTLTSSAVGTTAGGGVSYGQYTNAVKDDNADIAWVVAPDGQNVGIWSLSADLGGSPALSSSQATASFVTTGGAPAVPEPSSYAAIAGLAAVGFASARRRRSV